MTSIVDQLLGNIGTTSTAPVQASPAKAPTATQEDLANAATSLLASKSSYGSASATDAEKDLREMNPVQLTDKYGKEGAVAMLSALAAESQNRITDSAAPRSGFEAIGDTGLGVGVGAVNLLGGVGAFLGSAINDDLGLGVAKATQNIAEFGRGLESDELNQVRQDESRVMALAARDNRQAYDEEVAAGGNAFVAGAKRIGSDLVDQGNLTLDSGVATTDLVAEGLGSMLPVAKVSQGLSALSQLGRQALVKAGVKDVAFTAEDIAQGAMRSNLFGKQVPLTLADVGTSKGALGALDKLGNFAKVPAVIGAAEGGSAISETYDKAIAAGGTHEQALDAAMYARNMQATIGAATGTLVRNFEGNLGAKITPKQALGNLGREGLEEGTQEGTAASSANLGLDAQGLGDGDILAGVGSGAFKGIAGGMGSAALLSFPALATRTAELTGKGVAATATGLVNYASEKIAAKETKEAEAAQTVAVQALTTPEAKVEFADQVQTLSQQVVADAVARNAAPEEIAEIEADNTALSAYAAELQDALSWEVPPAGILPPTVDAALVGTTTVVEAINALAKFSKDTNNTGSDRILALENAVSFMEGINSVLEQDSSIASKHEQYAGLSEYVNAYENVFRSVVESADGIDGMQERFQALYDAGKNDIVMYSREAPPTPEAVNNTLTLASRIGTTDPKLDSAVQFVLEDLESGILELQPAQATKLKGIVAVREAARVRADAMKAYGLPAVARVTSEISLDDGSGKNGKISLNRYSNDVTTAMQSGNVASASKILENLRTFAQSMNNKAQAFSDHIDGKNLTTTKVNVNGVEQDSSTVFYQTRVANGSNTFRKSTKGVYVQFNNDSAVATAKTVYADAAGVTTAYNQLLEAFPELAANSQPQTIVPIHPKLAARKVGTAAQNTATVPVVTPAATAAPTPTTAPTTTTAPAVEPQNTEQAFADPKVKAEKAKKIKTYTDRLQEFITRGGTLESSATNLFNLIKEDATAVSQMKGFLGNKQKAVESGQLKKSPPLLAHLEKLLGESTETKTETVTETAPVTPASTETVAPTTVAEKTFEVAETGATPATPTPTAPTPPSVSVSAVHPMNYDMPAGSHNVPGMGNTSTYDLIEAGLRTSTTRGWGNRLPKVGEVIKFYRAGKSGVMVRVTEVNAFPKNPDAEFIKQWEASERWNYSYTTRNKVLHGHQVKFELVQPATQTAPTAPTATTTDGKITIPVSKGATSEMNKKDKAKFSEANKLIAYGEPNSSTRNYATANPDVTNTGKYTAEDTVGVSLNGSNRNNSEQNYLQAIAEIHKAMAVGATIITDQEGTEGRLAKFLQANGYVETNGNGVWKPAQNTSTPLTIEPSTQSTEESTETVEESSEKSLQESFPDLLGGENNAFYQGFSFPATERSKLTSEAKPYTTIMTYLAGKDSVLGSLLGDTKVAGVKTKAANAYRQIMSTYLAGDFFNALNKQLKDFATAPAITPTSKDITVAKDIVNNADNFFKGDLAEVQKFIDSVAADSKITKATGRAAELIAQHRVTVASSTANTKLADTLRRNGQLFATGKALNITFLDENGQPQYNNALMSTAIVAATQWLVSEGRRANGKVYTTEDASDIFSMPEEHISFGLLKQMQGKITTQMLVSSLRDHILRYWGLAANKNAPEGYSTGVAQGVAQEIIRALLGDTKQKTGAVLQRSEIVIPADADKGISARTVNFYKFNLPTTSDAFVFPSLIDDAVLVDNTTQEFFYKPEDVPVRLTQMHSNSVTLTEEQIETVKQHNNIAYKVDSAAVAVLNAIKLDGLQFIFGAGKINEATTNDSDLVSVEGINKDLALSFAEMNNTIARMDAVGANSVHYAHEVSSVSRVQQRGVSVPQSNKLMRIALTATKATVDLTDTTSTVYQTFTIALAQAFGVKVHNEPSIATISAKLDKMLQHEDVVKVLPILASGSEAFSVEEIKAIKAALKATDTSMAALQALTDYARFSQATSEQRKAFETALYIEADGVTNGIANTFMIVNINTVTANDLRNWGRVGLYLNQPNKTLNEFKQGGLLGDAVDVYTDIVDTMVGFRQELLQDFKDENKQLHIQVFSHISVLLGLFGEGASMDSAGNVTFQRNSTKQPSTAINYGSGAKAVSVQMMGGILSNMYATMTTALKAKAKADGNGQSLSLAQAMFGQDAGAELKFTAFLNAYHFLTNHYAKFNPGTMSYDIVVSKFQTERRNQNLRANMTTADVKKFLVAPYHVQTITKMLQITHADTVYAAAKSVLGQGTSTGMDLLMQSTNLHSTVLQEIFKQKVKDALAARKSVEGSNYNSADFLSKKELAAIEKEMRPLVPVYSSATQKMRVAKTTTSEIATTSLSTALNNSLSAPVEFEGISSSGVSGLAKFLLAMGDAQMIQSFVNDPELADISYLTVFDGIHGGLDVFNEVSVAANKAAFGAWIKNNPLQVVSKGFTKMGKSLTVDMLDALSPSSRIKIAVSLDSNFADFADVSSKELMEMLIAYDNTLFTKALIVRAKQNVLAKTKASVHQMAAGFTPFQSEGTVEIAGNTFAEQAYEFNLLVQKEFIRLGGREIDYYVPPPRSISEVASSPETATAPAVEKGMSQEEYETFTAEIAGFRGSEGVTVEDDVTIVRGAGGLYGLLRRLDSHYSTNQVRVLKALMDSMANSGVTVIFGTKATIAAKILKDRGHESNSARGSFYPDTNTIYIGVATTQTLVHELIHATTASILFTHYGQGSKAKSSPVKSAVTDIEKMMNDFINPDTRALLVSKFPQTSTENQGVLARYDQVVKVIQSGLNRAAATKDSAERVHGKVTATNEFMAHALTNFSLGSKVLPSLPSKFSTWVKGVKEAIMKLLGIAVEQMPKSGSGTDMFTNLLFNTQILAKAQEGSSNSGIDIGSMDDADFGNDPRLTDLHNKIDQLILAQSDETRGVLSGLEPVTMSDTGNAAIANFQMNTQEATVFNKMLAVLQADIALNSSVYTQAQAVYAHALKHLKVTDFEEDASAESEVIAQYRMAYLLSKQQGDVADKFSVFLALAATSEPMRKALSNLPPMPSTKSTKVGMDGVLENFGNKAIASISQLLGETNSVTGSTQQVLDKLLVDLFRVNKAASSFVTKVLEPAEAKLNAANEYTSEKIAEVASSGAVSSIAALRNKSSEKTAQRLLGNLATVVSDADLRARVSEGMARGLESLELPKPIQALVNDLVGRTESNKSIVDLIKPIKAFIARTRQSHINDDPITIQNAFSRKLENHEWEALNSGIAKADLAVFTSAQVASFLGGKTSITTEIGKLEATINNPKMLSKAKQLANYMMTGVSGNGLQRNAHAVANNLGSNSTVNASEDLVKSVDKLVSLYAFKSLSESTQTTLRDLAKTEKNGLEFLTAYMKGLRAEDQLKLGNTPTGKNNYYKGAMASTATADGSLIVRSVRERAALQKLGYVYTGKYLGDSRDTQARNMGYFYMPITVNPRFRQGLFQNIQITAGGINLATGHSIGSNIVGLVTKGVDIDNLIGSKQLGVVNGNEFLLPLFDAEGRTIGFERSVDPKQLSRFKYSTRIDKLAGKHRGRQVEERDAHQFNRGVITKLHEAYTADAAKSQRIIDREYVDLFDEKYVAKDPVLKNAMERLSHWSRGDIENTFGEKFLVRRSLVEDVLGYQAASVTDPFTGVSRWSPETLKVAQHFAESILGTGAMKKLLIAENTVQSTVGTIKTNIVVRSVVVPLVNIMSNVVHLMAVNVPIADITGGTVRKIKEAEFYAKSSKRLNVISAEKLVAKYRKDNNKVLSLTAEENSIKQSISRLSIADLISAGEFNSITDQDSRVETASNAADYSIKALIEKSLDNTSGVAREVIRYGLITEDTALFKNLQKAVFYGDFIAKSLMYDNLRKKGVSKAEALGRISEEFVNYDRNAGRAREALEDSGLLWFYNYKLRSVKIAARLIRDNPLNALLSAVLVPGTIGGVVADNAVTKVVEGSIYGSMGIDTGLRGAFMNPWMNLLD